MNTKIIFLDVDGVLNSHLHFSKDCDEALTLGLAADIDPDAMGLLNALITDTESKVVITSTWRLNRTVEELQTLFEKRGFTGEIIDKTKDLRVGEDRDCILRGNEILCWMKDNPALLGTSYWEYHNYVILDDDSDMLYWQRNNYLYVDPWCGLTPSVTFRAKKILNA